MDYNVTKFRLTFRRDGDGKMFEKDIFSADKSIDSDEVRGMIEEVGMKLTERFKGVWYCTKCEEVSELDERLML